MKARDLLTALDRAGLSVSGAAGRLVVRPASQLTDDLRVALREHREELLVLLASGDAPGTAQRARFLSRQSRLQRWGWTASEAQALAERLSRRDREQDARVSCLECRHARPGRCGNHLRAGLRGPALGSDLAGTLQHCPGYGERAP